MLINRRVILHPSFRRIKMNRVQRPLPPQQEYFKVMYCRVCGSRVRVWESYRTSRSFGHGYGSVTEHTEVPGIVVRAYRTHRSSGYGYECATELTEVPGTGMKVLQNFQNFRVLWQGRTEFTEVPGRYKNAVPLTRVLWHGRTDLTDVPGTGMNVVQNSQKFFERVWMLYRTHRSSGYG